MKMLHCPPQLCPLHGLVRLHPEVSYSGIRAVRSKSCNRPNREIYSSLFLKYFINNPLVKEYKDNVFLHFNTKEYLWSKNNL